jgi:hypothetical protein
MQRVRKLLVLFVLLVLAPVAAGAMDCPKLPAIPIPAAEDLDFQNSWQGVAHPHMARDAVGTDEEPAYGYGYLDILDENYYYDWISQMVLPLWNAPDEASFEGWIHSGRVYSDGEDLPYALTGAGLVETEYERSSLIVHEALADGWFKIRLKPGKDGEAWTHQCHLGIGKARLTYKSWDSFLREHGDWLHFRSQVTHMLRERPGIESPLVTVIGLDHKLKLLEVQSDWMRVVVEEPDQTCDSLAGLEIEVSSHEGWVRWRDDEMGPWVWVYTRGC